MEVRSDLIAEFLEDWLEPCGHGQHSSMEKCQSDCFCKQVWRGGMAQAVAAARLWLVALASLAKAVVASRLWLVALASLAKAVVAARLWLVALRAWPKQWGRERTRHGSARACKSTSTRAGHGVLSKPSAGAGPSCADPMASGSNVPPSPTFPVKSLEFLNSNFPGLCGAKVLGEGGFGRVHLVRRMSSGRLSAIKVLREGVDEGALALAEEAKRLWDCQGAHVVPFHAAFRARNAIIGIWMDVADTSLNLFLDSRECCLPEQTSQHILVQACVGAAHVHSKGLAHRDLKPGNILLRFDPCGPGVLRVWLADFGKACEAPPRRFRQRTDTMEVLAGRRLSDTLRWPWSQQACTVQYAAPEILQGLPAGCSADTWSLGAIGFEMILGRRLVTHNEAQHALFELESKANGTNALPEGRCDATWCKDLSRDANGGSSRG